MNPSKNSQRLILLVVLVSLYTDGVNCQKYCDAKLCPGGGPHIACKHSGRFSSSCPKDAKLIKLTDAQKKLFVDQHNALRSKVATGNLKGFKSAEKMPELQWDNELAYFAELNVKQCQMNHDRCRSTSAFPFAGQNLAFAASKPNFKKDNDAIKSSIQNWFAENKDANMSYIKKYQNPTNGKVIGHFTAMVNDKSTRIGCAVAKYTGKGGWKSTLIACNYSYTNMMNQPIYTSGKPCSKCPKGCSKTNKGLCKS